MTESHPQPAQQRTWQPCGCLLAMFLICVLLPVAAYLAWGFRAARQVESQLARIRQAGLPTSSEELDEYYRMEAGVEDATLFYLAAAKEFSGSIYEADCRDLPLIGSAEIEIPPPGQPWAERQAVEALLGKYDDGLQALHKAAAMGGTARFRLDFEQGLAMLLPDVQNMRNCSRMLSLEAHVKAHQGDVKGTAESLLALATISRSLENQPILISQLVRISLNGTAVELTRRLLAHVEFSDEDLRRLQKAFRRDDFRAGIVHAMNGERVLGAGVFKNPAGALGPNSGFPRGGFPRASNEDLALFLEIQTDLHDAVELPYPETFAAVDIAFDKLSERLATPLGRMRYVMTGLTLPAMKASVDSAARVDGSNRCLDAAIAVEQFRRREGRLPETLDELVPDFLPAVPRDPFDGQAIRYVAKQDGYLIYTCGSNRIDDGGVADEQQTDDVIRIDLKTNEATPEEPAPEEPVPVVPLSGESSAFLRHSSSGLRHLRRCGWTDVKLSS